MKSSVDKIRVTTKNQILEEENNRDRTGVRVSDFTRSLSCFLRVPPTLFLSFFFLPLSGGHRRRGIKIFNIY